MGESERARKLFLQRKIDENEALQDLLYRLEQLEEAVNRLDSEKLARWGGGSGEKGEKGSDGVTPVKGVDYFDGEKGDAGPNQLTTSTDTNITGLLKGSAGKIAQATAETDYLKTETFTQTIHDLLPYPHHDNSNDPSSNEKSALAGTDGTPSGTNKYVTDSDGRLDDARTPLSHAHSGSDISSGSLDGDRLAAPTTTKRGGVKETGIPSGKFLKDNDTWDTPTIAPTSLFEYDADGNVQIKKTSGSLVEEGTDIVIAADFVEDDFFKLDENGDVIVKQ